MAMWTARAARSLRSLETAATGTAWPARSLCSVGAATAGTAMTAHFSHSIGAYAALLSLPWREGDRDGVPRRAPNAPAAWRQRSLCIPGKDDGRREKQVRGQGGWRRRGATKKRGRQQARTSSMFVGAGWCAAAVFITSIIL